MILSNLILPGGGEALEIRVSGEKIGGIKPLGGDDGHGRSDGRGKKGGDDGSRSSDERGLIRGRDGVSSNVVEDRLVFNGSLVFPGLINSHEHLDFNNFPLLGNRIYHNYTEWGEDIHRNNKEIIDAVLKIPRDLRIQWGIYKNLLNGITTVVSHGDRLPVQDDLIDVYQGSQSLHSLAGEKGWRSRLNFGGYKKAVSIHIGEGTDDLAAAEIKKLIRWNLLRRKIVGIHGVALHSAQAADLSALIWCPDSNYFLLGRTAAIQKLKKNTTVLFGTDSTLTAHWSIWEHLRLAREQDMVTDRELFGMVTRSAAAIWGFQDRGGLAEGQRADLVIARPRFPAGNWNAFYALAPEDILLTMYKGKIQLFDQSLYEQLERLRLPLGNFYKIHLNGADKYVRGNLPALISSIRAYYPAAEFPITFS